MGVGVRQALVRLRAAPVDAPSECRLLDRSSLLPLLLSSPLLWLHEGVRHTHGGGGGVTVVDADGNEGAHDGPMDGWMGV